MRSHSSSRLEIPASVFNKTSPANGSVKKDGAMIYVKGGSNNVGNYAIDLDKVKANVSHMKGLKDVRIDQLNQAAKEKLGDVVRTVEISKEAGVFDYVNDIVKDVWSGVKDATPGTVGAYFIGCSVPSNYAGNQACSATCAGSITPNESTPGWSPCQSYSILYEPDTNTFTTLNNPSDKSVANIFIHNSRDFRGFTPGDVAKLKGIGVSNISITKYSSDGRQYTDSSTGQISLDSLLQDGRAGGKGLPQGGSKVVTGCSSSGGAMFLFLILLIIIIIVVAFLLLRSGRAI